MSSFYPDQLSANQSKLIRNDFQFQFYYSVKEEDTSEDNVETKMLPNLTSTTLAVKPNKLEHQQIQWTPTNIVHIFHKCKTLNTVRRWLQSRNYSRCEMRRSSISEDVSEDDSEEGIVRQYLRAMRIRVVILPKSGHQDQ